MYEGARIGLADSFIRLGQGLKLRHDVRLPQCGREAIARQDDRFDSAPNGQQFRCRQLHLNITGHGAWPMQHNVTRPGGGLTVYGVWRLMGRGDALS